MSAREMTANKVARLQSVDRRTLGLKKTARGGHPVPEGYLDEKRNSLGVVESLRGSRDIICRAL